MSYEILKERIETLPDEAMTRLEHYIERLCAEYTDRQKIMVRYTLPAAGHPPTTDEIDAFLDAFPDAFDEFKGENKGALLRIMERTKNETW